MLRNAARGFVSRIKDSSNRSLALFLVYSPPQFLPGSSVRLSVRSICKIKNSFHKARVLISGRYGLSDRTARSRHRRERFGDRGSRSGVPRREQALQARRHEAKVLGHCGYGLSAEQRGERGGRRELSENANNGEPRDSSAEPHSRGLDER